jgi:hypothetical protein
LIDPLQVNGPFSHSHGPLLEHPAAQSESGRVRLTQAAGDNTRLSLTHVTGGEWIRGQKADESAIFVDQGLQIFFRTGGFYPLLFIFYSSGAEWRRSRQAVHILAPP